MTVARSLAEFHAGLLRRPPPANRRARGDADREHVCQRRLGLGIASSAIIRASPGSTAGRPKPRSGLTRAPSCRLPRPHGSTVMSDAAASDDSDLRNIVHAGTTLVATSLAMAERTGASGQDAGRHRPGLRGVGAHWRGGYAWLAYQGLSRLPRVDLCRRGRHWAAAAAGRGPHGPGHRPVRDLDGWAHGCGEHERGP